MRSSRFQKALAVLAMTVSLAWALGPSNAAAQGHAGHAGHAGHGAPAAHDPHSAAAEQAPTQKSPHGGQLTRTARHTAEVVYHPRETRVYLYGMTGDPVAVKGIQGEMAMQVRGSDEVLRVPLKEAAQPAGSKGQGYLTAAVDVSRIRDGDMTVTMELTGLADEREPKVHFNQTFALFKARAKVAVAALTQADRAGIGRQQVCPVTGGRLGGMGTPVKVLVDGRPLYLCCGGCLAKVRANPEHYLAVATKPRADQ